MYPPIRCKSCGCDIGSKIQYYIEEKNKKIEQMSKQLDIPVDKLSLVSNLNLKMDDVLDKLGVYKWCCRGQMVTYVEFKDYYN